MPVLALAHDFKEAMKRQIYSYFELQRLSKRHQYIQPQFLTHNKKYWRFLIQFHLMNPAICLKMVSCLKHKSKIITVL